MPFLIVHQTFNGEGEPLQSVSLPEIYETEEQATNAAAKLFNRTVIPDAREDQENLYWMKNGRGIVERYCVRPTQ